MYENNKKLNLPSMTRRSVFLRLNVFTALKKGA